MRRMAWDFFIIFCVAVPSSSQFWAWLILLTYRASTLMVVGSLLGFHDRHSMGMFCFILSVDSFVLAFYSRAFYQVGLDRQATGWRGNMHWSWWWFGFLTWAGCMQGFLPNWIGPGE